jgi:uncharacterized membrane protein (DUF2068 family)
MSSDPGAAQPACRQLEIPIMTAFAGSIPASSQPFGRGGSVPAPHMGVGLVFGGLGAILLAIGGVGLPVALMTVSQRNLVDPSNQAAFDTALRLAPAFALVGLVHLIAAVGLVTGRAWGRFVAMLLSAGLIAVGIAGMLAIASHADPFAAVSTRSAAAAAANGLAMLAFVVVGYAIAFVTVYLRRSLR